MPQITKIKSQRNKKRVNVYLDGKFGFGIDLENFVKFGLKEGDDVTDEEIEEIIKEGEYKKIHDNLIKYATLRPRSRKEITDWLKRKKIHETVHDELLEKLEKLELIDDLSFASWWIKQRKEFKPRGKKALYSELMKKGVSKNVIENALAKIELNEEEMAKEVLEKKKYKWENLEGFDKKKKMSDYLARRGFSWDAIKKATKAFVVDD